MKREGCLAVCTIRELADELEKSIDSDLVIDSQFTECDFAIISEDIQSNDLEYIKSGASGWYGIKRLETGFDSTDLLLICDYYGGGCPNLIQIWEGMDGAVEHSKSILDGLLGCLNVQETAKPETVLIVDFLRGGTEDEV